MALDGQTAIVTGAGSGLGRAVALQLAREGADVACADVNAATAAATADAVQALGRRGLAIGVDVTSRAQVQAMAERVRAAWDRIDILVTSAGIYPRTAIVDLAEEEFDRVLATHVKGTFLCCQAVLPSHRHARLGARRGRGAQERRLRRGQRRHHQLHARARPRGDAIQRDGQRRRPGRHGHADGPQQPQPRGDRRAAAPRPVRQAAHGRAVGRADRLVHAPGDRAHHRPSIRPIGVTSQSSAISRRATETERIADC